MIFNKFFNANANTNQPSPKQTKTKTVLPYVLCDLKARAKMGESKYGIMLQTDNGREALWDAYQEALDLAMYLRQAILEKYGDEK